MGTYWLKEYSSLVRVEVILAELKPHFISRVTWSLVYWCPPSKVVSILNVRVYSSSFFSKSNIGHAPIMAEQSTEGTMAWVSCSPFFLRSIISYLIGPQYDGNTVGAYTT